MSQYYVTWLKNYELYKLYLGGMSLPDIGLKMRMPYRSVYTSVKRIERLLKERTTTMANIDTTALYNKYMHGEHSISKLSTEFLATPDVIVEALAKMNIKIQMPLYTTTSTDKRKKRVSTMLDAGASKKEVAQDLGVSVRTVENDMQDEGFIPVENVVAFKGKRKDYTFNKTQFCREGILDFVRRKDFLNFQLSSS